MNEVTGSLMPVEKGLGFAGRRAIGGTTHVWGGVCPRLHKTDFSSKSDFDYAMDWPIDYEQLAPYYCQAERWLRVADVQCGRSEQSPFIENSKALIKSVNKIGIEGAVPAAMSVNNQGVSRPFNLAIIAANNLLLRKSFRLLENLTARQLDVKDSGKIEGIHCTKFSGEDVYIKANVVVLCGGAIQNARLLLLSKSNVFRDGVGNSNGHVGARFMDHPNIQYWVKPKDELLGQRDVASFIHSTFLHNSMKSAGMGAALLRFGAYCRDWQERLPLKYLPESRAQTLSSQTLLIEALCEQEPRSANRISLSEERVDRFGDPLAHLEFSQSSRDRRTIKFADAQIKQYAEALGDHYQALPTRMSSHHLMGTTRMGKSEKDSVVDENLKVHAIKNLYIAGGSVFSSGGAANPTLTLTALAFRLADHLISSPTA